MDKEGLKYIPLNYQYYLRGVRDGQLVVLNILFKLLKTQINMDSIYKQLDVLKKNLKQIPEGE